jgi:hypothetical protein
MRYLTVLGVVGATSLLIARLINCSTFLLSAMKTAGVLCIGGRCIAGMYKNRLFFIGSPV